MRVLEAARVYAFAHAHCIPTRTHSFMHTLRAYSFAHAHHILPSLAPMPNPRAGFIIGHVTPEAQVGGNLALVQNGDRIVIGMCAVHSTCVSFPVRRRMRAFLSVHARLLRVALRQDCAVSFPKCGFGPSCAFGTCDQLQTCPLRSVSHIPAPSHLHCCARPRTHTLFLHSYARH